jgi:hypothetical protein
MNESVLNDGSLANQPRTNSFITSGRTEYKSPCLTVPLLFCFYSLPWKCVLASRWLAMDYSGLLSQKRVLASCWLTMDYSGFQASCHNILLDLGEICEDGNRTEMG